MLQKFKLIAYVRAINSKGETGHFNLEKPCQGELEPTEKEKELFFGEKFRGRKGESEPCDFVVVEVIDIDCVPEPFYLSVTEGGRGSVRLGNYDSPEDLNPSYRKSPLTGLTVNFEMLSGEGLVFCQGIRYSHGVAASKFRWTAKEYIVTNGKDEIWTFPKSDWELHLSPVTGVDYVDPDNFRDSLPEVTSW